jgi:undecaprenyl-diphosphatase
VRGETTRDAVGRAEAGGLASAGGAAAAASLVAFAVLTLLVAGRDGAPWSFDTEFTSWSLTHRPDVALALARGVTYTGTGVVPYALVVVAGLVLGRTTAQRVRAVAVCVCCLALAQVVRYTVMSLVARPRPPEADWATHASGWSFPSGHATTSAVAGGLLVLAVLARAPRCRNSVVPVIAGWSVLVGLSRVYLGVHWFSDVLGGWLFAVCWLSLFICLTARFPPRALSSAPAPRPPSRPTSEKPPGASDAPRDTAPDSAPKDRWAPQ